METILKIDNIEKYYGNKSNMTKAIDGISFAVETGEFVAIMGASGSGKTTLPLRYNNDKQKKPLFSRGLSVCRLLFNSFSKLKIDENYKEKRRLFY